MLDRKLLVEALRIENKDVLPKFGSPELRKMMEAATEYISLDKILDLDDNTITENGIYTIMDMLDKGSVGIADENGQPALNFMKSGDEIYAHNMFTDEDDILDATGEALAEYIMDQMETGVYEEATVDATNVIFKREPNEYTDEIDILAVFPDEIEQAGDEGNVLVYNHVGQHSYASPFYIEELEDATPEEYEDLKEELEGQGYELNVLNGLDQDLPEEAEVPEVNSTLSEEITGNYGLAIGRDIGNDVEILEIREGYNSMEDVQSEINEMEGDYEFQDDPTMMLFAVYTDGISWFNAVTGEEIDYEKAESVNEENTEQELYSKINNKYGEDVWVQLVQDSNVFNLANEQEEVDFINKWSGKVDRDLLDQFIQYAIQGAFESVNEASSYFTSLKEARREIARAKRKLQAKLDKGNFYENFGREEVRAIKDRIPSYAEDMNQDELRAIQDEVAKFDEWCATAAPKQESRKNEVSDELKNKVAARRQIDAEIANDAENEILVKHGRKSKEYKKAHAKTNAAINKLNKFGRSSHDIIKSKEYQAMDDGKYAAPGIVRKNENSYDELKVLKGPKNTMNVHLRNGKFIGLHIFRNADSNTIYQITPDEIKSGFHEIRDGEETAQEYIDRIAKIFDVPTYKLESRKNEALSLDELLNMYKEEIEEAKARLDKCYKRVEYRLKENVSYSPEQATPIIANLATDVRTKSSEVVDEVYRKLG